MNAQAIQSAEILVRFANPSQDGKPPNIRASDGTTYGVKPADFGRFQPGGRYRIEYVEKGGRGKWQGRTFRDIVKCEPIRSEPTATTAAPTPSASGEVEFVTTLLAASIQACAVDNTQDALIARARLLRGIYREVFAAQG